MLYLFLFLLYNMRKRDPKLTLLKFTLYKGLDSDTDNN